MNTGTAQYEYESRGRFYSCKIAGPTASPTGILFFAFYRHLTFKSAGLTAGLKPVWSDHFRLEEKHGYSGVLAAF